MTFINDDRTAEVRDGMTIGQAVTVVSREVCTVTVLVVISVRYIT